MELSKVLKVMSGLGSERGLTLLYLCPGCRRAHAVEVEKPNHCGARWTWDGNAEKPTLSPSVDVGRDTNLRCHHFIRNGMIEFCADSHHSYKGKTVPLLEWDGPKV